MKENTSEQRFCLQAIKHFLLEPHSYSRAYPLEICTWFDCSVCGCQVAAEIEFSPQHTSARPWDPSKKPVIWTLPSRLEYIHFQELSLRLQAFAGVETVKKLNCRASPCP
jgi:hypothetical protein